MMPEEMMSTPRARRIKPWMILALEGVFGATTAVIAARTHAAAAADTGGEGLRDVPRLDGKWIRFSESFAQRAGIKLAPVEFGDVASVVSVTGTVTMDPRRTAAIGARISGRVRNVLKYEGDDVKAGDVLAEIESAELGQAQAGITVAKAHAIAATANEKRERALADQKVSAEREAEAARANAEAARAEQLAAEQKVRALGGSTSGNAIGILALTSPISGRIVERKVARGQTVEPSLTAFRVADLTQLWVELAVFERELGVIRKGDKVEIAPQTNVTGMVGGVVAHVGETIELETRSASVRVVVEGHDGLLRPGQSVTARIHTSLPPAPMTMVPREAVTMVDGKPTVFVSHDATSVEPRAIELGDKDQDKVEVVSGLKRGEIIVIAGAFALKSEIFR